METPACYPRWSWNIRLRGCVSGERADCDSLGSHSLGEKNLLLELGAVQLEERRLVGVSSAVLSFPWITVSHTHAHAHRGVRMHAYTCTCILTCRACVPSHTRAPCPAPSAHSNVCLSVPEPCFVLGRWQVRTLHPGPRKPASSLSPSPMVPRIKVIGPPNGFSDFWQVT